MTGPRDKAARAKQEPGGGAAMLQLLSFTNVAQVLGVSVKTVQRRVSDGALPVIEDGGVRRVHPDDLDRYIAARRHVRQ